MLKHNIKTVYSRIFLLTIFSLLPLFGFSQFISAKGKAFIMNGNVQFTNSKFDLPANARIVSIKGDKTSFSIYGSNNNIYNFYYSNDGYEPNPFQTIIKPGFYTILPNLPKNKDSVTVLIEFEIVRKSP